jgi:hypothetical protein
VFYCGRAAPTTSKGLLRSDASLRSPGGGATSGLEDITREFGDTNDGFVIEVDEEVVGAIQYAEENEPMYRHAGIDIFVTSFRRGQGLGSEAIRLLARYLFDERGHHRLTIDPAAEQRRCYPRLRTGGLPQGGSDAAIRARPRRHVARWPPHGHVARGLRRQRVICHRGVGALDALIGTLLCRSFGRARSVPSPLMAGGTARPLFDISSLAFGQHPCPGRPRRGVGRAMLLSSLRASSRERS